MPWYRLPLHEIDLFPFGERDDRLLPVRPSAKIGAPFPLLLPGVLSGVHTDNFLAEYFLDRLLDLKLIGSRIDPENVLIVLFAQQAGLFGQADIVNQTCRFVHANLSASLTNASLVTMI